MPGAGRRRGRPGPARDDTGPAGDGRVGGDVRRIAVVRGGGLGDVLFALPAMDALAAAFPRAQITLLGTALHARLFAGRPGPPHRVDVVPGGLLDGGPADRHACESFFARIRAQHFDLAVQVHGGGRHSNRVTALLGARRTIGLRSPEAPPLGRTVPYRYYQHEMLRALEVVALAGARPVRLEPSVPVVAADRARAAAVLAGLGVAACPDGRAGSGAGSAPAAETGAGGRAPLAVVHPGATDPRRRWPGVNFARVAAGLAADGMTVLVIGAQDERGLCERVARAASSPAVRSVAGSLDEHGLVGVLAAASVVVADDSGPRHLAQAVGTRTVGIYWIGNVINAAPLGRARHRIHLSWTAACPVCGLDCTGRDPALGRCGHDVSFVADVPVDPVLQDARELVRAAAAQEPAPPHGFARFPGTPFLGAPFPGTPEPAPAAGALTPRRPPSR